MRKRSTIDAISKITTKILNGFRRKEETATIFFDIEKAYDKVITGHITYVYISSFYISELTR